MLNCPSDIKLDDVSDTNHDDNDKAKSELDSNNNNGGLRGDADDDEYPSGEFEYKNLGAWKSFMVKLRILIAYQRVRQGSVLHIKLRGKVCLFPSFFGSLIDD